MITESTIYWAMKLDALCTMWGALTILGSLAWSIAVLSAIVTEDDEERVVIKKRLPYGLLIIIPTLLWVFTPTTKQFVAIKTLPMVTNNEQVQQLPTIALDWVNRHLAADSNETD
jgi:hypothetical protein